MIGSCSNCPISETLRAELVANGFHHLRQGGIALGQGQGLGLALRGLWLWVLPGKTASETADFLVFPAITFPPRNTDATRCSMSVRGIRPRKGAPDFLIETRWENATTRLGGCPDCYRRPPENVPHRPAEKRPTLLDATGTRLLSHLGEAGAPKRPVEHAGSRRQAATQSAASLEGAGVSQYHMPRSLLFPNLRLVRQQERQQTRTDNLPRRAAEQESPRAYGYSRP